jgi:hypothetical protein
VFRSLSRQEKQTQKDASEVAGLKKEGLYYILTIFKTIKQKEKKP